jgi:ElaB/YqjD/DUF883 family membrane-anchored ribosome-binding protein
MSEQSTGGGAAVGDKVEQAKSALSDQTDAAAERGRGMVEEQLDRRSTQVGERVQSASQTLRQVAQQSRAEGNDQQARMADMAADRSERVSAFLIETDGARMVSEAEDFARRQPWVLAAAGVALGFALARALKVSSTERYQSRPAYQPRYSTVYSTQAGSEPPRPAFEQERLRGNGEPTTPMSTAP